MSILELILDGSEPLPNDLAAVCQLVRDLSAKLKRQRERMDELWQITNDFSRLLGAEQARCAHLQNELGMAVRQEKEATNALVKSQQRVADLLNKSE